MNTIKIPRITIPFSNDRVHVTRISSLGNIPVYEVSEEVVEWLNINVGDRVDVPGLLIVYQGWWCYRQLADRSTVFAMTTPDDLMRFKLTWQ